MSPWLWVGTNTEPKNARQRLSNLQLRRGSICFLPPEIDQSEQHVTRLDAKNAGIVEQKAAKNNIEPQLLIPGWNLLIYLHKLQRFVESVVAYDAKCARKSFLLHFPIICWPFSPDSCRETAAAALPSEVDGLLVFWMPEEPGCTRRTRFGFHRLQWRSALCEITEGMLTPHRRPRAEQEAVNPGINILF